MKTFKLWEPKTTYPYRNPLATDMQTPLENNPIRHTQKIKAQLRQIITQLRDDVGQITEARAKTLFESSATLLDSMVQAFDDYEQKGEEAWRNKLQASLPNEGPVKLEAKNSARLTKKIARRIRLKPIMQPLEN
jgi:hypothetical protein